MAKTWCPFATKKEMPYNNNLPTREQSATLILHTNGGATDSGSLYGWFSRPGNDICSHFQVMKTGTIEQYVSLDREAYAEFSGNAFGISVETEDDGNPNNPWSAEQLASIIRLCKWLKIPARVSPDGPGGGVGWHQLYANWNESSHNCPGSVRVAQIHSDVIPGIGKAPGKHPHPTKPTLPRVLSLKTPNMTGTDVKAVQKKLKMTVDGIYGPRTAAAVKVYQKAHKLTVDGVVGPETRKALGL